MVLTVGLATALLAVYLIWVVGKAHKIAMLPVPHWVPAFAAEVHPFIPASIVTFYAIITWDSEPSGKWVGLTIATMQLVGWLLLADDDDDRWKRRRRRLIERLTRRPQEA